MALLAAKQKTTLAQKNMFKGLNGMSKVVLGLEVGAKLGAREFEMGVLCTSTSKGTAMEVSEGACWVWVRERAQLDEPTN